MVHSYFGKGGIDSGGGAGTFHPDIMQGGGYFSKIPSYDHPPHYMHEKYPGTFQNPGDLYLQT